MHKIHRTIALVAVVAGLWIMAPKVAAQSPATQSLDFFVVIFKAAAGNAEAFLRNIAISMAISLAILEIVVFALSQREKFELRGFVSRIAVVAFFIAATSNVSQPLTPGEIVRGAEEIATGVSGLQGFDPSTIVDQGIFLFGKMMSRLFNLGLVLTLSATDGLAHVVAAFATLFAFLVVALQVVLTLVQGSFLLTLSPFFMAFGTSRWTIGATEAFLNQLMTWSMKVILLGVVISIGDDVASLADAILGIAANINSFGDSAMDFQVMVLAVAYALSAAFAPGMVASKVAVNFNISRLLKAD